MFALPAARTIETSERSSDSIPYLKYDKSRADTLDVAPCNSEREASAGLGKSDGGYYWHLRHFGELFFHLLVYYLRTLGYQAYTFFITLLKFYRKAANLASIKKNPTQDFQI